MEIPCNSVDFHNRISNASKIDSNEGQETNAAIDNGKKKFWFHGEIEEDAFRLALILKRPNNFIPVIHGIVSSEPGQCNLVLKYELFPATKRLLLFWSLISIAATLFFAIPYHEYFYAAISLSFGIVNYVIAFENFKMQCKKSRRALERILLKKN